MAAAECLEGIAGVAVGQGQPSRAAQLLGAAERQRATLGIPIPPPRRARYERSLAATRGALSEADFARDWVVGRALPLEAVLAIALESTAFPEVAPSPASTASLLSPRELEVLRLLVEGMSNQEIAAALFISPRTVINHVASIMNKLGLDSRTAVAAWAIRNGVA
jgi:DNA-binding CsgD family transcriptional regulator